MKQFPSINNVRVLSGAKACSNSNLKKISVPLIAFRLLGGQRLGKERILNTGACALFFLSVGVLHLAQAAPGDLDISFAGTGKARLGFGLGADFCRGVAVQPDGKLILAGYSGQTRDSEFAVVRFDTNNVLDESFGLGGKAHTPILSENNASAHANAVALQDDGKIVLAGYVSFGTNEYFALVRFNTDGSLDNSFGVGGIVTTDFGHPAEGNAMVIQSDQKIIIAGSVGTISAIGSFALTRYNIDGSLDSSFGSGGKIITSASGGAAAYGVALQSDGKILAAGTGGANFALIRYTASGALDTTFGTNGAGAVFTHLGYQGSSDGVRAVAVQIGTSQFDHDKIIVAGSFQDTPGHWVLGLTRYSLGGSLDASFGNNGTVTKSFSPAASGFGDRATALLVRTFYVRPSNSYVRKITLAGYGQMGATIYMGAAQYDGSGALDATWPGHGAFVTELGGGYDDEAYGLTVQGDRLVIAGTSRVNGDNTDFVAVRLNPDGSFDNGVGGVLTADIADSGSYAAATAVQSDGKIILAGDAYDGARDAFAVARYNGDGSLDTSFGQQGKVTTSLWMGAYANAADVQPDGKIVAAGAAYDGTNYNFALVRYNFDGSLDASFATDGQVITRFGAGNHDARAVRFQTDGKIVAGGVSTSNGRSVFGLARYNSDGSLDSSFGGSGKVTTAIGNVEDVARSLAIQADGKIVAAGSAFLGNSYDFALVRYNTNGSLDNSFGSFGRVATDFSNGSSDAASGMVIQPDGRIVLAGSSIDGTGRSSIALARYLANGTPDASFGQNGKVLTQASLNYDSANGVAVQSDGKILAAGISSIGGVEQFVAVRYRSDGWLDSSYGTGGKVIVDFGDGIGDDGYALALDQIGRAVIVGNANKLFGIARLQGDPFLKILSIGKQTNGNIVLQGMGVPSRIHSVLGSSSLSPGSYSPLGIVTPDAGGLWRYEDSTAFGVSQRFYRLSLP